jgi:ComF family protein
MALINDFMSLIYPRHCEACGNNLFKHETFLCNHCKLNLNKSNYHLNLDNELNQTFAGRVPLTLALCYYLFEKSGKIQRLLHAIKYQNQKELAQFIGELYATELLEKNLLKQVDVILPIPLHINKLKLRGYNQSEWFAKGISKASNIDLNTSSLVKSKETTTQTKKRKYQRWENVDNVFSLDQQKHVLLVDDVITTGATIEAAWQALKQIDGIKISVMSIAFANQKI